MGEISVISRVYFTEYFADVADNKLIKVCWCIFAVLLQIQLSFPVFKLDKPNDCDSNFVDVFSDRTDLPSRQKNYCGSIADAVTSKNNTMFVRFLTEAKAINSKFEAQFTAFREKKNNEGRLSLLHLLCALIHKIQRSLNTRCYPKFLII